MADKEIDIQNKVQLFNDKKIRTVWDSEEEQWYFSVIDVIAVLTDSLNPRDYWFKMKKRVHSEDGTVDNLSTVENAGSRWENAAEKRFLQKMQKRLEHVSYRLKKKTITTKIFRMEETDEKYTKIKIPRVYWGVKKDCLISC